MQSTSLRPELRFAAGWLASEGQETQDEFLSGLPQEDLLALQFIFEFWAMEHQLPPDGSWHAWVAMGGRGAGKTRAGAEWVRTMVEGGLPLHKGRASRIALVGETYEQVRDVMVFGESGILACSPPDRRPHWEATRRRLVWPNGATAQAFSASDPESLRGPQFDCAWADELAKWKKAREAWDMLQFALRLGDDPRVCVTTTPRNTAVFRELLERESTVTTSAPTEANRAYLAASFLEEVRARYSGTRLGRQELEGLLETAGDNALWTPALLERCRAADVPELDRIVVAVDPPVTSRDSSDECGIVVAGARTRGPVQDWRAFVLADCSVGAAKPLVWARAAVRAMEQYGGARLVAEVNQGGDLVQEVIRQVDPLLPVRCVHASWGKAARAEPVAALYEQGRVFHMGDLGALEEQLCAMTVRGYERRGSPDRLDALVWALTELMIEPAAKWRSPSVRAV